MNDTVSIIVPVYNRAEYIEECVASVLSQSYQNFEIILVDDGSSDNSNSICLNLAEKDPRIKFFSIEHSGVSIARNKALQEAKGDYLFFLDSDDIIHPSLLEALVTLIKENNCEIAATEVLNVSEKYWAKVYEKIEKSDCKYEGSYLDHTKTIDALFMYQCPISVIGGIMIRRDFVGDTQFNSDIYIGEDFLFIYENVIKGASAAFLKQKWYYVRLHKSNSSWDFEFSGFMNRFLRREIVWKNEEALGRKVYADTQKSAVLWLYLSFIERNGITKTDEQQMRSIMKSHRKDLYSSFGLKEKIIYIIFVYTPLSYKFVHSVFRKIKTILKKGV